MKYNKQIVAETLKQSGIPKPTFEFRFHPVRKWRMDLAWPKYKVFLEVQGGIWTNGRHSRGAAMLKEWEKINTASTLGWRVLYCQPKDLLISETIEFIREAIEHEKQKPID